MNIPEEFSQKLKNTLIQMQLDNNHLNSYLDSIKSFLQDKNKDQLISIIDFSSFTGLDREKAVLFFSLLSFPPNKYFNPVTIPYALGKPWSNLKQNGIITDKEIFEPIPDDLNDDGFVPLDEIELILNYQVCNE